MVPSSLPPTLAKDWSEKVFQLVIASSDQLMHVALYQWLVNQNETDKLLSVRFNKVKNLSTAYLLLPS